MSTESVDASAERDPVADLAAAAEDLQRAEERVEEFGEGDLKRLGDALDEFTSLLARYEDRATGDGDFQAFIEFQGEVARFVERLPDDLLLREVFEDADERLQQRRLTEDDFERVRTDLEPVADLAGRLDERANAVGRYRSARNAVRHRRAEAGERIDDLERLQELGEVDLDAPVERLREPIAAYDDRVADAFQRFRRETSAREVFAVLADVEAFPLVDFQQPPADLREFVESAAAGEESIEQLLEYAEYSRSKLDHYVADPGALKAAVRPHTTYLRRLDAEPLRIGWPPPPADELRWRCRELTAAVNRIAPKAVAELRRVAALPAEEDYERLRTAAVARAELSERERERLQSGAVAEELEALREERERLAEALSAHPER